MKITEELIKERTDAYIEKHKDEILADIDNRIAKAVKSAIKDYFSNSSWTRSESIDYIQDRIKEEALKASQIVEIDTEEIERLVVKKVNQQVKKISINIGG